MHNHPRRLFKWYNSHQRDLPWRANKEPYKVWVSEIILQQTRVQQGLDYYHRFIARFPCIASLAEAPQNDVLRVWEGLGYYRRAVNMQKTAAIVMKDFGGIFPVTYQKLIKLPGIGDYTASAISSICGGERHPTIDGNVRRFVSRLYNIHELPDLPAYSSEIRKRATFFTAGEDPGVMNQAMMEFGALQCIPKNPQCSVCPFSDCAALAEDTVGLLPFRRTKKDVRTRYFNYYIFQWKANDQEYYLMTRRGEDDIWGNLYEFPMKETTLPGNQFDYDKLFARLWIEVPKNMSIITDFHPYVQQLTHQKIYARIFCCRLNEEPSWYNSGLLKVTKEEMMNLPKPGLINRYLRLNISDL